MLVSKLKPHNLLSNNIEFRDNDLIENNRNLSEMYNVKLRSNCEKWKDLEDGNIMKHIETHISKGPLDKNKWKLELDELDSSIILLDKASNIMMFKISPKYVADFLNGYINYEHRYVEYSRLFYSKNIKIKIETNGNKIVYYDNNYFALCNNEWLFTTDAVIFHKLHECFFEIFPDFNLDNTSERFYNMAKNLNSLFDEKINNTGIGLEFNTWVHVLIKKINDITLINIIKNYSICCHYLSNTDGLDEIINATVCQSQFKSHEIKMDVDEIVELDILQKTIGNALIYVYDNISYNLTIKIDAKNIIYYHQTGPNEVISFYDKNINTYHYKSTNTTTKEINVELTTNVEGNYDIIAANDEMLTKNGELIVRKGCYSLDKKPCLVKLIIPKNGKIIPNGNGDILKLRTNKVHVAGIYEINTYKCLNCNQIGIFKNPDNYRYYCHSCAKGKNYKFVDLDKCTQHYQCNAPIYTLEYTKDTDIVINSFSTTICDCAATGIYFFIDKEMILSYVFGSCGNISQTDNFITESNSSYNSLYNSLYNGCILF